MGSLDEMDWTLLFVAGYIAVISLVRLMLRRRDQLIEGYRRQAEEEKKRREEEAKKEEQLMSA